MNIFVCALVRNKIVYGEAVARHQGAAETKLAVILPVLKLIAFSDREAPSDIRSTTVIRKRKPAAGTRSTNGPHKTDTPGRYE